jgi:hypothetical protein
LKWWVKLPAVTAQNRGDATFKGQVARNAQELEILDILETSSMYRRGQTHSGETYGEDESPQIGVMGKAFFFTLSTEESCIHSVDRYGRKGHTPRLGFDPTMLQSLDDYFRPLCQVAGLSEITVQLVTEIKLVDNSTGKTELLRAHPNFRGEGCWYDYVEVSYGEDGLYPARVAMFFLWPETIPAEHSGFDFLVAGDAMVVLQEANYQTAAQQEDNSLLFSHYVLKHKQYGSRRKAVFAIQPATAINRRILAVNPNPGDGGPFFRDNSDFELVRVKDRLLEWPNIFLDSYQVWT